MVSEFSPSVSKLFVSAPTVILDEASNRSQLPARPRLPLDPLAADLRPGFEISFQRLWMFRTVTAQGIWIRRSTKHGSVVAPESLNILLGSAVGVPRDWACGDIVIFHLLLKLLLDLPKRGHPHGGQTHQVIGPFLGRPMSGRPHLMSHASLGSPNGHPR